MVAPIAQRSYTILRLKRKWPVDSISLSAETVCSYLGAAEAAGVAAGLGS